MLHNLNRFSSLQIKLFTYWVLAFIAMAAPAFASQSVTLAWDPNPEPDIAGYRLKYGTLSGNYGQLVEVGNTTTTTVPNLTAGTTYYFVVTAVNSAAMESLPSNEVSFVVTAPTNQPPTVAITSPADGTTVMTPVSVILGASASDPDGSISRVEYYNGATKLGEATASPYALPWNPPTAGTYVFTARAIDNLGATANSGPVTLTVLAPVVTTPSAITSLSYSASTGVQVGVTGTPGVSQNIYVSTDLKAWTLLATISNTSGTTSFTDSAATTYAQRFYRVSDGTSTSDPMGFTKLTIAGNSKKEPVKLSYLGVNMVHPASYKGTISSKGNQTVTDSGATWNTGEFDGSNGEHYLEITSGPYAGLTTDILAADGGTKTLTLDDDLSALLSGGEKYTVRKHRTIADVFGKNNEARLKAGNSVTASDEVRIFNPVTQDFLTFYYNSASGGWRSATDSVTDASNTKLYLEQGLVVRRKAVGSISLVVTSAVKLGPTLVPIGAKSNLCANMYPVGTLTLATSGLYTGSLSGLAGASGIADADEVQIWNGTVLKRYYYKTGGSGGTGWREAGNTRTDASKIRLNNGSSSYVVRKNGRPAFNWKLQQPF